MSSDTFDRLLQALSKAVRDLRSERGLTQVELAKVTGRSQSSIARVEGEPPTEVSLKMFFELADALGMDLSEMIKLAEVQAGVIKKKSERKARDTAANFWLGAQQAVEAMPGKKRSFVQHMVGELIGGVSEV